jgi:hypothetical protein
MAAAPEVGESGVSIEAALWPGEMLRVKPGFLQTSDEGLTRKTRFLLDWRLPFTSMACGLVKLVEMHHPYAGGERLGDRFASADDPPTELALVNVPEGASVILRPSYLVGVPTGDQPQAIGSWCARCRRATATRRSSASPARARRSRWPTSSRARPADADHLAQQDARGAALLGVQDFFPENAVEYFVSYYDYYQPEAYMPSSDTYIEKDSSINEEIERLRIAATSSLVSRRDVIVVASVSCIYGLGSPEDFTDAHRAARGAPSAATAARAAGGQPLRAERLRAEARASACAATWST